MRTIAEPDGWLCPVLPVLPSGTYALRLNELQCSGLEVGNVRFIMVRSFFSREGQDLLT